MCNLGVFAYSRKWFRIFQWFGLSREVSPLLLQLREEVRSIPKVIQPFYCFQRLCQRCSSSEMSLSCKGFLRMPSLSLLLKDGLVAISKSYKPQTQTCLHHPTPCCYDKQWRCNLLLRIPKNFFFSSEEPTDSAKESQVAIITESAADWLNTPQQITWIWERL